MIISHKHKYLFVEIPRTGSTAISHELCDHYNGERILRKHSFYSDFLKIASPEEKNYFVFSGIRNPLDEAVSWYFKVKTNHKGKYTNPFKRRKKSRIIGIEREARIIYDVQNNQADFQSFFMKYYVIPYNNWASLMDGHYDYLIRFENLQEDFARALQLIGLEPKRPLPIVNSTAMRKRNFWSYYSPAMIPRAKWIFGPFMKQWGYEFPPEWGDSSVSWLNQKEFDLFSLFRKFKWKYLRFTV